MTRNQQDLRDTLANYPNNMMVDVATSQYSCSKATGFWSDFVTTTSIHTLKSFESKGWIKIVDKFWRGATIEILTIGENHYDY